MDDVGKLIRHVGSRASIDADRFEKASARVEAHWETVVAEQRKSQPARFNPNFAIAASVVLAVAAGFLTWRYTLDAPPIDSIVASRIVGEVRVDGRAIATGDTIPVDGVITTANDSRVALQLADGQSLRIDEDTQLVASAESRFGLGRGAVYFDSGRSVDASPVFIDTPYGVATDIGTQFQVRLQANTVVVGVREGIVALSRPGLEALTVDRGQLLEIADDGGADRREIEDDSMWDWVNAIAPEIDTNDMTLANYLDWYAREKGYEIEWADTQSRDEAMGIRLSVSIQGLTLDEGLAVAQATAPFEYEIDDGTMRVYIER